jgi:hypothetical protein
MTAEEISRLGWFCRRSACETQKVAKEIVEAAQARLAKGHSR